MAMYRLPVSCEMNLRLSCCTKCGYSLKIQANVSSGTDIKTIKLHRHASYDSTHITSTGPLRPGQLNQKTSAAALKCSHIKSFSSPYLGFLGRRYQDMVDVIAISAEKLADLRKGSATKWITARQWPSPDTCPPFPGSLSD